jgi:hypothetical protein
MDQELQNYYKDYWNIIHGKDGINYRHDPVYMDYCTYYIDKSPSYVGNLKLTFLLDSLHPETFIYKCSEQLFYAISTLPYFKYGTISHGVHRRNHGGIHQFRSFLFGAYAVELFLKGNSKYFTLNISNNKVELIFLFIAMNLFALMRVDEGPNPINFFNNDKNKNIFETLFPNISIHTDVTNYFCDNKGGSPAKTIYMATLASSFIYMSMCKYFKANNAFIHNNLSDEFIEKVALGLCMYEEDRNTLNEATHNLEKIFLIHGIVSIGHFSDHCRFVFSDILEQTHIDYTILKMFEGDIHNQTNCTHQLIRYIISVISFTEYTNYERIKKYTENDWLKITSKYSTKIICQRKFINECGIEDRYNSEYFSSYSHDFNLMYKGIYTNIGIFDYNASINQMINNPIFSMINKHDNIFKTHVMYKNKQIHNIISQFNKYKQQDESYDLLPALKLCMVDNIIIVDVPIINHARVTHYLLLYLYLYYIDKHTVYITNLTYLTSNIIKNIITNLIDLCEIIINNADDLKLINYIEYNVININTKLYMNRIHDLQNISYTDFIILLFDYILRNQNN